MALINRAAGQPLATRKGMRAPALALAVPALALSIGMAGACGGSGSSGFGGLGSSGTTGGSGDPSGTGTAVDQDATIGGPVAQGDSSSSSNRYGNDARGAGCDPNAPDQVGCPCQAHTTRSCYSGPSGTRGVGACQDGTQTCAGTEFPTWAPCAQQVLPQTCDGGNCEGNNFCTPPPDAAPEAEADTWVLPPHCHIVQGFNGNGMFSDGALYCEGTGFGLPGLGM
jgi:hypothetical protein